MRKFAQGAGKPTIYVFREEQLPARFIVSIPQLAWCRAILEQEEPEQTAEWLPYALGELLDWKEAQEIAAFILQTVEKMREEYRTILVD